MHGRTWLSRSDPPPTSSLVPTREGESNSTGPTPTALPHSIIERRCQNTHQYLEFMSVDTFQHAQAKTPALDRELSSDIHTNTVSGFAAGPLMSCNLVVSRPWIPPRQVSKFMQAPRRWSVPSPRRCRLRQAQFYRLYAQGISGGCSSSLD